MSIRSLLNRLPSDHPVRVPAEKGIVAAEKYAAKRNAILADPTLTDIGKRDALRKAVADHIREHTAANESIAKLAKQTQAKRAELGVKPLARDDYAGAVRDMELRAFLARMEPLPRAGYLETTDNVEVLAAALRMPPEVSGVKDERIAAKVEERYARLAHGAELDEIEVAEHVAEVAAAISQVAIDNIRNTSGLSEHEFKSIAEPIQKRVGAPWILRDGTRTLVVEVDDNGMASYAPASEWQIANGVEYKSAQEWRLARAAA